MVNHISQTSYIPQEITQQKYNSSLTGTKDRAVITLPIEHSSRNFQRHNTLLRENFSVTNIDWHLCLLQEIRQPQGVLNYYHIT